jgi:hypothetical protein
MAVVSSTVAANTPMPQTLEVGHPSRRVRDEHVAQAVAVAEAEPANRIGQINDAATGGIHFQHIGMDPDKPTAGHIDRGIVRAALGEGLSIARRGPSRLLRRARDAAGAFSVTRSQPQISRVKKWPRQYAGALMRWTGPGPTVSTCMKPYQRPEGTLPVLIGAII